MTIIAFFNASGGLGQTSLVYHLAWMYESIQVPVLVADLDPQAKLTSRFLDTVQLDALWGGEENPHNTIYGVINGLLKDVREPALPHFEEMSSGITLIPGDLSLAHIESPLSKLWHERSTWNTRVLDTLLALRTMFRSAAVANGADVVLLDIGPNLTALSQVALTISDTTVIPAATDLRSLYGLRTFGPALWQWRREWTKFLASRSDWDLDYPRIPAKAIDVAGYVVQDRAYYFDRLADLPDRWRDRVRREYERSIVHEPGIQYHEAFEPASPLATIRYHTGLLPLAEDARKPMFRLTPADGVFDDQIKEVSSSYRDFADVAKRVAESCGIELPSSAPRS